MRATGRAHLRSADGAGSAEHVANPRQLVRALLDNLLLLLSLQQHLVVVLQLLLLPLRVHGAAGMQLLLLRHGLR